KSRDLDPRHALTAYALGKLYRRVGRHRAALGQFARLVGLAPDDAEGHILLGYSAFDSGEYNRAKGAFQTALALDSTNGDARAGYQRADRAVARQVQLKKHSRELVWKVGFRSPLTPLTLPTDGLELRDASLGAPSFGPGGDLSLTSGKGDRYQIYTLSGDGMRLDWRAASSSGYSGFAGDPERFLVAVGSGRGRKIVAYDSVRKTSRKLHRGYCEQPQFSEKARAVLCVGPQGVVLVNLDADRKKAIYREEGGRHPRFSRDGVRVVLADGDSVVWLDRSGLELGRVRLDGGRSSASHPAFSPDGRWIVSGERGLYLTSIEDKSAIALDNPFLKDGRRAVFSPDGRALVFESGGRLYRLELPRRMGSFFSFHRSAALVQKRKFAESVRLLRGRPPEDRRLSAYHLLLGRSLFGLDFYQKAESAALRAAKLDMRDWRPILLLAHLKARQGMLDVSARLMDRAVELGPDQFDGYFYRARIRGLQGRDEEAIKDYQIALERLGSAGAREGEEAMMGLLDLYVKKERINDALLLLLENAERLSRKAIRRIRMGLRYRALQEDPRFEEVMAAAPPLPAEKGGFLARRSSAALPENPPADKGGFLARRSSAAFPENPHREVLLMEAGAPGGARFLPRGAWGLKNKELGVHVFW
ncbi:MAG: tetratricopeptide repeat protein, partial [bacterium]